jgi:AsmA protein
MKKLLIGLGVLAVLLVTLIAAAPFVLPALIPVEIYKAQIANAARAATGRELAIKGDFKLAVLPRLEIEANDVSFANAPGAAQPEMVTLKQLLVRLELLPILFGRIKVDRFVLVEPVIHLEVDKDGRANWVFETAGAEASGDQGQTEDTAQTGTEQAGGGQAGQGAAKTTELTELNLGEVRLEGGQLTYSDLRSGQNEQLDDINMELSLPDLDSPFGASGSLVWHGEKLTLSLEGAGRGGDLPVDPLLG